MKEIEYDKIVRDNIPRMITEDGSVCDIQVVTDDIAFGYLCKKLDEEISEFWDSCSQKEMIKELADIIEVALAIAENVGKKEELKKVIEEKREKNGAFKNNFILKKVYKREDE
jgi:predicted house-cleaning noncanonical NTP pyrophosphatase (MazG superfamily)